jgi:hypothetical protein
MTEATTHPVSPEELMAHLDGQLPADRALSVASHVADCSTCREYAADLRNLSDKLHAWPSEALSPAVEERILAAQSQISLPRSITRFPRWSWKRWTVVAAASGCIALLLMAIAIPNLMRSKMAANEASEASRLRTEKTRQLLDSVPQDRTLFGLDQQAVAGKLENKSQYLAALPRSTSPEPPPPPPRSNGDFVSQLQEKGLAHATDRFTRADNSPLGAEPMIARVAELRVVVPKFADARAKLEGVLVRYRAYAASLQISTAEGSPRSLTASLRIPAAQLNSVMAELKALGRVEAESQSGEEVTEQHADLVARLKNSRETELRLQDILRTRTGKVKDVLEVEEEISRVRGEIEQMEAERQTLEHRVDFATLNLTLAEEFKAQLSSPAPSLGTQWRNSIVTGFRNAFDSLFALILFLSEAAPVLLLWLAILSPLAWLLWRRYRTMHAAIS